MKLTKKQLAAAGALVVALGGAWTTHQQQPDRSSPASASHAGNLDDLRTAPERSDAGYFRDQFPTWRSTGHGCTMRDTVLIDTGSDVRTNKRCTVQSGTWHSAYDGVDVHSPRQLDMDHLVPLAEAYRSGANQWNAQQREQFANDPLVLIPVSASSNRSKGDRDPAEWKPSDASAWCANANRWIEIKQHYDLSADAEESAALAGMQKTCR